MAFGIKREELIKWKKSVKAGEISFLTHYWLDDRFPNCKTVTKVGCSDINKLVEWGRKYDLKKEWIHYREDGSHHFDLLGEKQIFILKKEKLFDHIWK